jgi:hypothetical protein
MISDAFPLTTLSKERTLRSWNSTDVVGSLIMSMVMGTVYGKLAGYF